MTLAQDIGIPERALEAIRRVESGGDPHAVRFEPHVFNRPGVKRRVPYTPGPHGFSVVRSETDRNAFARAYYVDPPRAVRSTSWGAFQVMGGLLLEIMPTPATAVIAFDSDPVRIGDLLLARWFAKNPLAGRAARRLDWLDLARRYNGVGNAVEYARRLGSAYRNQR